MKGVLGIDLGSTTTKAVLLNEDGSHLGFGLTNTRANFETASAIAKAGALADGRLTFLEQTLAAARARGEPRPEGEAGGGRAAAGAARPHFADERRGEAGTTATKRVSEGDGSAVDVDLGGVEPEFGDAGEGLGGERLVQLDEVEVVDRPAGPVEGLAGGRDRTEAHACGIDAGGGGVPDDGHGFEAELAGGLFLDDEPGGGPRRNTPKRRGAPPHRRDSLSPGDRCMPDPQPERTATLQR